MILSSQNPRLPRRRLSALTSVSFTIIILIILPTFTPTFAQSQSQTQPQTTPLLADSKPKVVIAPDAARKLALDQLTSEAEDFRNTGRIEVLQPDFAARFPHHLQPDDVTRAILTTQYQTDGPTDGYIRWQLLSFNHELSEISPEEFQRFVTTLPLLTPNPASSETLQANLEKLAQFAGRNEDSRKSLQNKWENLRINIRQFDVINLPSVKFRDAIPDLLPETGQQRPAFLLYDLRDRIKAGLSTRKIKSRITRELKARRIDESITPDQRWRLIKQIEAMADNDSNEKGKTRIIRDITFHANAPAEIKYSTLTVTSSDANKWTNYLNRRDP